MKPGDMVADAKVCFSPNDLKVVGLLAMARRALYPYSYGEVELRKI
jgi:hypothetical protein